MKLVSEESKQALINEFPHLILNEEDNQSITKKNLVVELKKSFPKFKFSVTKAHYDCYYIKWENGVTEEDVTKVVNKFVGYENDCTGDFRDFNPSDFNRLFGSFKYVFCSRTKCENFKNIWSVLEEYTKEIPNFSSGDLMNLSYAIFRNTSLPFNAVVTGLNKKENFIGSSKDAYYITFTN
jgi:hypothetical protein